MKKLMERRTIEFSDKFRRFGLAGFGSRKTDSLSEIRKDC